MQFIEHQVGKLIVSQRKKDGYINATKLAKAYQKKTGKYKNANNWFEKDRTHEYLKVLSKETGLEVEELVQKRQEIWIHHQLAISFAMWLSPEFEMMVSKWVYQWLLTGKEPVEASTTDLHPYQRVWYQRLMLFEQKTKLPPGTWCVFGEIGKLMRNLEANQIPLHDRATIDISIGRAWCHWLRENGKDTNFEQYVHSYPDQRGEQLANVYPFELLGEFRQWLQNTYIPEKFPEYVRKFCTPEECQLISQAIEYEVKPKKKRLKQTNPS